MPDFGAILNSGSAILDDVLGLADLVSLLFGWICPDFGEASCPR